jgi:hypothetical protein
MTLEVRQRGTFRLVTFHCCGHRYINQAKAVQHLQRYHEPRPEAARAYVASLMRPFLLQELPS